MEGILFEVLRYVTMVINMVQVCRRYFSEPGQIVVEHYLSFDNVPFSADDRVVPAGCVYVCEYLDTHKKHKAIVQYEHEVIKQAVPRKNARTPWIWIGDINSETDLTEALSKFMVPDNKITYDLLNHLLPMNENVSIQYIDKESVEFVEFPEEGIVIREDDSV